MAVGEHRKKLDQIMKRISKDKHIWRFNFSVGCSNGDVFGSSWEDETRLETKNPIITQILDRETKGLNLNNETRNNLIFSYDDVEGIMNELKIKLKGKEE